MGIFYQNYAGFKIYYSGGYVNLSDHVEALTITRNFDQLDVTSMGSSGHQLIAGLEASTIAVDFLNDTDSSSVMQTLNALAGTVALFKAIQNTTLSIGSTNPVYTGSVLVNKLTPIVGQIGTVSVQSLSFDVSGAISTAITGTW